VNTEAFIVDFSSRNVPEGEIHKERRREGALIQA
jgi:hypothetical protein